MKPSEYMEEHFRKNQDLHGLYEDMDRLFISKEQHEKEILDVKDVIVSYESSDNRLTKENQKLKKELGEYERVIDELIKLEPEKEGLIRGLKGASKKSEENRKEFEKILARIKR